MIVRKSVTRNEFMDFCSAPVRFGFPDSERIFVFCGIRDIYFKSGNDWHLLAPLRNRGRWPTGKQMIKLPIMLTKSTARLRYSAMQSASRSIAVSICRHTRFPSCSNKETQPSRFLYSVATPPTGTRFSYAFSSASRIRPWLSLRLMVAVLRRSARSSFSCWLREDSRS